MAKKILIGIAAIVAILLVVILLQPADFKVERSTTIAAPAAEVFEQVNDFHAWEAWSPWATRDPQMKTTYAGSPSGKGAIYSWSGNDDVGEGRMTIEESTPGEKVGIKLEFLKPMAATHATMFTFKPEGEQTLVTWTMTGKNGFMSKAFNLFMNIEKMVGGDFEKGLAKMKAVVERRAAPNEKG